MIHLVADQKYQGFGNCSHINKRFSDSSVRRYRSVFRLFLFLFLAFSASVSGSVQAAGNNAIYSVNTPESQVSFLPQVSKKGSTSSKAVNTAPKPKKKGWVTDQNGNRISYHKNYKPVKGLVKIGKYY